MKHYTPSKASKSRRDFLRNSLKAGAAFALLGGPLDVIGNELVSPSPLPLKSADKPLNILILGGTSFLGPQQIAYALGRGHSLSIFTRGKTKPTVNKGVFEKVEHLVGDRKDNLEALKGRTWDAVIDNSGYKAAWTRDTANLLKDNVDLYLYTSSTGVYYPYLGDDINEGTKPLLEVPADATEDEKLEYDYGVMKANSELEAKKAFGEDRTIVVRPTYMMGPGDRTDRFTYWPIRLSMGGEILVPGKADDPVQYIDVRDVSYWMIRLIEEKKAGTYNAVGPASSTGMHAFVYGAHAAFSSPASFVMVDDHAFLETHGVPYSVPWIMPTNNNYGTARTNNQHAIKNGLTFTPLAQSVRDTYDWWQSDAISEERRKRLVSGERSLMAREAAIIAAWRRR